MSNPTQHSVSVETATSGAATAYTTEVIIGQIQAIKYTPDGSSPLASTADFTITTETTAQNLWVDTNISAAETVYPVVAANLSGTGAASSLTEVPIYAAQERVKIVIAQGGNTKLGTFTIISV